MVDTYEFIILDIQEDELGPKVSLLRGLDDFGNVDTRYEQLEVLHNCDNHKNSSFIVIKEKTNAFLDGI
jgi:hypothetical protein